MRKSFVAKGLQCLSLFLLLSNALLQAGCGTTIPWTGTSETDTNLNIFSDVTIVGPITVNATTCDVTISMQNAAAIQGDPAAGDSRLYLNTAAGRTITWSCPHTTTFRGAAAGATGELDLLVVVEGEGQVIFEMQPGFNVHLERNGVGGGAVQFYCKSGATNPGHLEFRAVGNASLTTITGLYVDSGSLLSFLSTDTDSRTGIIRFGLYNQSLQAEMFLNIADQGAVLVRGNLLSPTAPSNFVIADINPAVVAGTNFVFDVYGQDPALAMGLLVENSNQTLGQFLWDPWCSLGARTTNFPYGAFSGIQYGFIVGSTGELSVQSGAFLDYVALSLPVCPTPTIPGISPSAVSSYVKARNPSALFTDSFVDSALPAPVINIAATAGVYFRSGVGNDGTINADYTVDPSNRTPGAGVPVFDIEGQLFVVGNNTPASGLCFLDDQVSKIELLSWQVTVTPTAGPLFTDNPVESSSNPFIFPLRTFAQGSIDGSCGADATSYYIAYNKACILNNGRADLYEVSLDHTDEIHVVLENNDVSSEPTYIGGETWNLPCAQCIAKPLFEFFNSRFNVHTSVALTGVDLLTAVGGPSGNTDDGSDEPLSFCQNNISLFVFYQNGNLLDNGTGRSMILGTFPGSTACDGCTVVSKDAQLNVMQDNNCDAVLSDELVLTTTANTQYLLNTIPAGDLSQEYAIQTIYLGNNSNISVGTYLDPTSGVTTGLTQNVRFASYPNTQSAVTLNATETLLINSNLFSFQTRGGSNNLPETSNVTGQGGIFVDTNGTLSIGGTRFNGTDCISCLYRAIFGAMVTVSGNGTVFLPANRVLFDPRVGISYWRLNMNIDDEQVIVGPEEEISDYSLNWLFLTKNDGFVPYYLTNCYSPCSAPAVTQANVTGLPTIEGIVEQLLIKGSRLGAPAHVRISGGNVEELILLSGYNSAEAPVAVIVLDNQGQVGIGTAHRNDNSLSASVQLGVNGVNIILDGDEGQVNLNEDVIVNNICSFLPGPNIAEDGVLRITSNCCKTLRITKDGVMDLSAFSATQALEFAGNVHVVFEPGAKVIFDNATVMRFADDAVCEFEPIVATAFLTEGVSLMSTDSVRVKFVGNGIIEFTDCSSASLPVNAFVGVQNDADCAIDNTSITLRLLESSKFRIGDPACETPGGAFQVGNTAAIEGGVVNFALEIDGAHASFEIGEQGFFGLGVGVALKLPGAPDNWLVAPTFDVNSISLDLINGRFMHAQLYATSDTRASVMALCGGELPNGPFSYAISPLFDTTNGTLLSNMSMLGGGNIIACPSTITPAIFAPVVGTINGVVNAGLASEYEVGILDSTPLLATFSDTNIDGISVQQFLRVQPITFQLPANGRGVAAPSDLRNQVRVGYVDNAGLATDGFIGRAEIEKIVGKSAQTSVQQHSLAIGVVSIVLEDTGSAPRAIVDVNEIGQ